MNPSAPLFSVGTRAAGAVIVLGYLLRLVPGAVVSVVGGLALITFGRALLLDRNGSAAEGVALAVVAGALGVGALRWGTLELEELVGVQSVLGPTVLVGPDRAALATGVAMGGALAAVAAWLSAPSFQGRRGRAWWLVEALLAVGTITTVFAAPGAGAGAGLFDWVASIGRAPVEWGIWAAIFVGAAAVTIGAALFLRSRSGGWTWVALVVSAAAVVAGAGLIATVL